MFDVQFGRRELWKAPLRNAHGVVLDWKRPNLQLVHEQGLPEQDGHDLLLDPLSRELILTTGKSVYRYAPKRDTLRAFELLAGLSQSKASPFILVPDASPWFKQRPRKLSPTA